MKKAGYNRIPSRKRSILHLTTKSKNDITILLLLVVGSVGFLFSFHAMFQLSTTFFRDETGIKTSMRISSPMPPSHVSDSRVQIYYSIQYNHSNSSKSSSTTTSTSTKTTTMAVSAKLVLPPICTVLHQDNIIGDTQFLLDFAIIGNGKCGTTSMQQWLASFDFWNNQNYNNPDRQLHSSFSPATTTIHSIVPSKELYNFEFDTPASMIQTLYKEYAMTASATATTTTVSRITTTRNNTIPEFLSPNRVVLGYKNPEEIRSIRSIRLLHFLFPNTVLFVGIRHPVDWFESYYNFKVQNLPPPFPSNYWISSWNHPQQEKHQEFDIDQSNSRQSKKKDNFTTKNHNNNDPNTMLLYKCMDFRELNCVGTGKGLFHVYLANLGKTLKNESSLKELEQLYPNATNWEAIGETSNPIFLYDVQQLSKSYDSHGNHNPSNKDHSFHRLDQLQHDIKSLFGISTDQNQQTRNEYHTKNFNMNLDPSNNNYQPTLSSSSVPHVRPGTKNWSTKLQMDRDRAKINICDETYLPLRLELLRLAKEISQWIRYSGFLDHPDVYVSSRDYFEKELLGSYWMNDPCIQRGEK